MSHVPFRQSKLTSVLRDALGGNCKTLMIANVWAEEAHLDETASTLRFASRVRLVETNAQVNESQDLSLQVERYKRQVKELKQELLMRDALSGRGRVSYDDLNEAELTELRQLCKQFLEGSKEIDDLPQDTMKLVRESFKQMRNVYQELKSNMSAKVEKEIMRRLSGSEGRDSLRDELNGNGLVGDEDPSGAGFAVGNAPPDSKPEGSELAAAENSSVNATAQHGLQRETSAAASLAANSVSADAEKNTAFISYKRENAEGRVLAEGVATRQREATEAKSKVKQLAAAVNEKKQQIDLLSDQVKEKRDSQTGGEDIDVEEYDILSQLKKAKHEYRDRFDQLKDAKSAHEIAVIAVTEARKVLLENFETWYSSGSGLGAGQGSEELDPNEAYEKAQVENWRATDPDAAAYLSAQKVKKQYRPAAYGGDKGRAQNLRRMEALR
uniref:Kinesin-like protein n=1 Tax=Tetraselmis sp. GSL018 TaxID=582737 RepID=A0A061SBX2_9CHLO